jgi:catalase
MILFGDRGVPDGYRFMHGYSGHTFKLVKDDGSFVYAQIHARSNQGVKFLTQEKSVELAGKNPDCACGGPAPG